MQQQISTIDSAELRSAIESQLGDIDCAGSFATHGHFEEEINPGLEVAGCRFGLPLYEKDIRILTEINGTRERRSWDDIALTHPLWLARQAKILDDVCTKLGVPGGSSLVRVELNRLLVNDKVSKYHEYTKPTRGAFAMLVVCLPSAHEGGEVVVSSGHNKITLPTALYSEWQCSYLAWYSDVNHEFKPVTHGCQVVLSYNLIYYGPGRIPTSRRLDDDKSSLRQTFDRWQKTLLHANILPPYLVYPLEHKYTAEKLCLSHLKAKDLARVVYMDQITKESHFSCFLASMERVITRHRDDDDSEDENDHRSFQSRSDEDGSIKLKQVLELNGEPVLHDVSINKAAITKKYVWDREPDGSEDDGNRYEGFMKTYWYEDCVSHSGSPDISNYLTSSGFVTHANEPLC